MDLTKIKTEIKELLENIKTERQDLESILQQLKEIQSIKDYLDTFSSSDLLEEVSKIKKDFKTFEIELEDTKTDLMIHLKSLQKKHINKEQEEEQRLNKIYTEIKNKLINDKNVSKIFKEHITKQLPKQDRRKQIKGVNSTDLIFRGLIVVSLIFSTINLFKGGNTETIEQPQQREHIESSVSPYCIDYYNDKGEYTPFTQHRHLKGECRE